MQILIVVVAIVLAGGAAAVAAGHFGQMPTDPVRPAGPKLPEGDLTADGVRGAQFDLALRGYDMAQVDALLARLGKQLAAAEAEKPADAAAAAARPAARTKPLVVDED